MRRVDRPGAAGGPAGGRAARSARSSLEPGRHEARVGDTSLDLTPTEFRLLEALVRADGDIVPHLRLARAGWPAETDPDLLWLKPHLARLRAKLEARRRAARSSPCAASATASKPGPDVSSRERRPRSRCSRSDRTCTIPESHDRIDHSPGSIAQGSPGRHRRGPRPVSRPATSARITALLGGLALLGSVLAVTAPTVAAAPSARPVAAPGCVLRDGPIAAGRSICESSPSIPEKRRNILHGAGAPHQPTRHPGRRRRRSPRPRPSHRAGHDDSRARRERRVVRRVEPCDHERAGRRAAGSVSRRRPGRRHADRESHYPDHRPEWRRPDRCGPRGPLRAAR